MSKLTILTPVHVGTGEMVEPICYQVNRNGTANRYSLADVVSSLPANRLCDPSLLKRLAISKSKMDYYQVFNSRNISGDPLYKLTWNINLDVFSEEIKDKTGGSNMIAEQVKTLGKPIIPGSSLKGAVECAFKYWLLKQNLSSVKENLNWYFEKNANSRRATPESFYLSLVYGLEDWQIRKENYSDFIKDLYGTLSVSDVTFNSLEALFVDRYTLKKDMNLGAAECIPVLAQAEVRSLFEIDQTKVKILEKKYSSSICQELIQLFCSEKNLVEAIRVYSEDMLESDETDEHMDIIEDIGNTVNQLNRVRKEIRNCQNSENEFVIRIGKYTSYFYKTVSWLFRENFNQTFKFYFYDAFSPAPGNRKNSPKADSIPRSIPFLTDDQTTWTAGFVKVVL